jgi:hypothetical protein
MIGSFVVDGVGDSDSAGSDEVSVPCDAVYEGRGDHGRAEHDRVCFLSPFVACSERWDVVRAGRRLLLTIE